MDGEEEECEEESVGVKESAEENCTPSPEENGFSKGCFTEFKELRSP